MVLKRAARWTRPSDFEQRAILLAYLLIACFAVFTRFSGALDSLWVDEISVVNVLFSDIGPSKYAQYPLYHRPLGHLLLAELTGNIYNNELVLRLPSILASLGTVAVCTALIWSLTKDRWATLLIAYITAVNPVLAGYAKEFKPYSTEAFFFPAILLATHRFFQEPTRRRSYILGITVMLGIALGYPTIFMAIGVGIALLPRMLAGDRRAVWPAFTLVVISGVGFLLQYYFFARHTSLSHFPQMDRFLPPSDDLLQALVWPFLTLYKMLSRALFLVPPLSTRPLSHVLFLAFAVGLGLGLKKLFTENRAVFSVFVTPFFIAIVLTMFRKWLAGSSRTNTWAVAGVLSLSVYGWATALPRGRWTRSLALLALMVLATPWSLSSLTRRQEPLGSPSEQWREIADAIPKEALRPGGAVAYNAFVWKYGLNYYTKIWESRNRYQGLVGESARLRLPARSALDGIRASTKAALRRYQILTFFLCRYTEAEEEAIRSTAGASGAKLERQLKVPGCLMLTYKTEREAP